MTLLDPACVYGIDYTLEYEDGPSNFDAFMSFDPATRTLTLDSTDAGDVGDHVLTLEAHEPDSNEKSSQEITVTVVLPAICVTDISYDTTARTYQYTIGEQTTHSLDIPTA